MMVWNAGWALMLLFPVIMLVAVAVMATVMARAGGSGGWPPFCGTGRGRHADAAPPAQRAREDPLVVLRERYARGEIDKAEFERVLDGLLRTEPPTHLPPGRKPR